MKKIIGILLKTLLLNIVPVIVIFSIDSIPIWIGYIIGWVFQLIMVVISVIIGYLIEIKWR